MRKEIKRLLKVTADKIKNPGSLGAQPKRDRSSKRAYPTLPTTEEEADDAGTNKTEKWVNNNSINRAAKKGVNTEEDVNSKPPDYDQYLGLQHRAAQGNPQMQYNLQLNQGMYQPTFPMNNLQNAAWFSSNSGFNQMQLMGTSNIPSREQTENEKK